MGLVFSWLWGQNEARPLLDVVTEAQVSPLAEAAVETPAQTEVPTFETTVLLKEAEQKLDVCEPEVEVEVSVEQVEVTEVEAEQTPAAEPVTEAEEPTVEAPSDDQVSSDAVEVVTEIVPDTEAVEDITEIPKCVTEAAALKEEDEEEAEAEVEVLPEGDTTQASAELVTETEDVPIQCVEVPEVPSIIAEEKKEEAEAPVTEVKQLIEDSLVENLTVTEPPTVIECEITESAVVQQEPVAVADALAVQTECVVEPPAEPEPEPIVAPTEEVVSDCGIDLLPEEPMSNVCDMACPMQLSVDSVQLSSVEMSMDTVLSAHMAPEVPIEG
ncbi:fibrous sheath CABYR-binding protein-like isoform X5 [Gouania willdenowi]|uniref:fibrous sheath CABYR-binding protein-like isoform X5 n=1 Tax=Gouania willdenowi TaxID=441366 RepID=UPI0010562F1E|nr:fibrous sheath CABYR-binding protein-like isoform X5 [Gouania willdenowi]